MKTRRDVFQAIADPTRRKIINMVASQTLNLNSIAENFNISRQAVSLHIKNPDRTQTDCYQQTR